MQLNKIIRAYQGLIISIGILIICGFGFVLGVVPLAEKAIDQNREFNTLSAEVDVLKNKVLVLETIDEGTIRNNLQTLLSAVPSDKSLSTLLSTIDGLTAQTGISVDGFLLSKPGSLSTVSAERLSADERAVGSDILPFTISIAGTLDQIRAFLTASTSVRRLFRIRTFDVSLVNANAVLGYVAMDAFYSPLPSTIGSASQPVTALSGTDNDLIAKVAAMQLLVAQSSPLPPPSAGAAKPDPFSL